VANLGLAAAGDSRTLPLHDDQGMLVGLCLSHLPPEGVPLEAVASPSDGFGLKSRGGAKDVCPFGRRAKPEKGRQ